MDEPTRKFNDGDTALFMHWGVMNEVKITYGSFDVRGRRWEYRLSFVGEGDGISSFDWNTSLLVSEDTLYKDVRDLVARHKSCSPSPVKLTLTLEFPNV